MRPFIATTICLTLMLIGCTSAATPTSVPTTPPPSAPPTSAPTDPPPTQPPTAVPASDTPTLAPSNTSTPLPGATSAPANTPTSVFITYQDFEIVPAETTISVGTQVIFLIKGSLHQPYNFTAPNTFEAQPNLGDGTSYAFTFNEAGTVTLLCGYHPNMSATLIVTP